MMKAISRLLLLGLCVATCMGCWQEIRYEPKDLPSKSQVASATPADKPASASPLGEATDSPAQESTSLPTDEPTSPIALDAQPAFDAEADELFGGPAEPPIEPTLDVPLAAAWRLGSKWSLAVCIFGRGYDETKYGEVYSSASDAAIELAVELPPPPEDADGALSDRDKLTWAIDALLKRDGPSLEEAVGRKHSSQHRALCDLAIETHVLLLNYLPSREEIEPSAATLRILAREAELPAEYWQPVVTALEDRAAFSVLKSAVLKLHKQTATYLEGLASE